MKYWEIRIEGSNAVAKFSYTGELKPENLREVRDELCQKLIEGAVTAAWISGRMPVWAVSSISKSLSSAGIKVCMAYPQGKVYVCNDGSLVPLRPRELGGRIVKRIVVFAGPPKAGKSGAKKRLSRKLMERNIRFLPLEVNVDMEGLWTSGGVPEYIRKKKREFMKRFKEYLPKIISDTKNLIDENSTWSWP